MDLIAIAQQTGDVSPESYQRLALRGSLQPPEMAGVEELLQRMAVAEAAANPFANGGGAAALEASPSGGGGYAQFRPPAVIPPSMASPSRSQARSLPSFPSFGKGGVAACVRMLSQTNKCARGLADRQRRQLCAVPAAGYENQRQRLCFAVAGTPSFPRKDRDTCHIFQMIYQVIQELLCRWCAGVHATMTLFVMRYFSLCKTYLVAVMNTMSAFRSYRNNSNSMS